MVHIIWYMVIRAAHISLADCCSTTYVSTKRVWIEWEVVVVQECFELTATVAVS